MNIRNIRLSRKLTQDDLADKLNVSRTTVVMWESGNSTPKTKMLPLIAEALDCEIKDLFE